MPPCDHGQVAVPREKIADVDIWLEQFLLPVDLSTQAVAGATVRHRPILFDLYDYKDKVNAATQTGAWVAALTLSL